MQTSFMNIATKHNTGLKWFWKPTVLNGRLVRQLALCLFFCLWAATDSHAQVGLGGVPGSKSLLDLQSSTRALQVPRMSTAAKTTFTTGLGATHKGMVVFDSTLNRLEVWTGSGWQGLGLSATPPLTINAATNAIGLNAGTAAGDLMSWNGANWVNISGGTYARKNASNMQPTIAMNYCISLYGVFPSQNGGSPFIGEIQLFGFNFDPVGFARCNGQLLAISEYDALFALIGTTYGGDGQTTFAVPDLRGRIPIHFGQGSGLSNFVIGQQVGTEKF